MKTLTYLASLSFIFIFSTQTEPAYAQGTRTTKALDPTTVGSGKGNVALQPEIAAAYDKLPLSFEANQGQKDRRVKFFSRGHGYTLFLTPTEAVLALSKSPLQAEPPDTKRARFFERDKIVTTALRIKLLGANPLAKVEGLDQLPGKSNYFIGSDPKKWRTNVPTYARVKYDNIYHGIDLIYYGNQRQLENDFRIEPGADPGVVRLKVIGAKQVHTDSNGNLVVDTKEGAVQLLAPTIYQEASGNRIQIPGKYKLWSKNEVGFEVAPYDRTKPLTIDPVLVYSTYLGGSGYDQLGGLAVDSSGNAYVTGATESADFPTANALQSPYGGNRDAFVTKLNSSGSALIYSTYLGGNQLDEGHGIAVDASGNAYVAGITRSSNFPTSLGAYQAVYPGGGIGDGFVAKIGSTGTLVYSTYLGGNGSNGDSASAILLDSSGNAYVTGATSSSNFPTTTGAYQRTQGGGPYNAFVTELNPSGSGLVYSTYLGGNGFDTGNSLARDSLGNIYVTGGTSSTNFPTTSGALQTTFRGSQDGYATKFDPTLSTLIYSTYISGSSGQSQLSSIVAGADGSAYVTGASSAADFPTTPGAFQTTFTGSQNDAVVFKLSPTGALVYSTFLAGSGTQGGDSITVDSAGNAWVSGGTTSTNFPLVNPIQGSPGGSAAIISELNSGGSALLFSTYLGGGGGKDINAYIVLDGGGNPYVAGQTDSTTFPTTPGAFQTKFGGGSLDAFVAKIFLHLFAAQIQPPINADGSSVFSATRGVVPVKFTLTSGGAPTCQLPPATISLARTAGAVLGSIDQSIFVQSADTGSYFRIDSTNCQYVYNLASSSLGPGTYLVQISIDNSVVGSGTFGLK